MPRKPKLAIPLTIQRLSDGRAPETDLFDDFTGEAIAIVAPALPSTGPLEDGWSLKLRQQRAKVAKAEADLARLGLAKRG